jgi:hypothetical protein
LCIQFALDERHRAFSIELQPILLDRFVWKPFSIYYAPAIEKQQWRGRNKNK